MRSVLASSLLVVASCQTSGQAKITAVSATSVALLGGYLEHDLHADADYVPISLIFGGIVAAASLVGVFVLDDFPRVRDGDEQWRPSDHRAGSELLAAIQRTACFGACPIYTLAIYRDGTAVFRGRGHVDVCGEAIAQLDAERVRQLERQLIDARVTALDGAYIDMDATDASSSYLWFRLADGDTKSVAHYHGDFDAPEALTRAERAVDDAANVKQWVGNHRGLRDPGCK